MNGQELSGSRTGIRENEMKSILEGGVAGLEEALYIRDFILNYK